ncbi:hypothetical protein LWI28_015335 [Acer negundo]|uniref:EF-hand domain-containing protein n=1 Tax=Acer negundo TaxID=4023 RepID=A0AAD5IUB0_ACENE|nr:hypothetical protein LWI28_015335 [Acer negundo]KAK4846817.1 hypothetical protein QYF36_022256 [Acer negundo]
MANKLPILILILPIFVLAAASPAQCRHVSVSDGIRDVRQQQGAFIQLNSLTSSDSCEQTYGFLPCTTNVLGNVFLIVVYGYVMFLSAKLLSDGSEILLQIIGPGIIGGFLLPVLSSVPDATIILASGLSGSNETAQSQVSVGMGLLAGSTVMLLTILWGSCLIVGKCDIQGSTAVDLKDTKTFSLTGSGVSTDIWTSYAARIMLISIIPFIIVQIPEVFHISSGSRLAVLISLIVSVSFVLSYSFYQVFQPWIQKRRIARTRHKHLMLFKTIDENSDGYVSATELRALIIGFQFDDIDTNIDAAVERIVKDFDTSRDSCIDIQEFVTGMSRWLNKATAIHRRETRDGNSSSTPRTPRLLNDFNQEATTEQDLLGYDDHNDDEAALSVQNPKWKISKAVLMLLIGTIIAAVCSDPLVDAVDNFSTASSIPSFFVSFIILPFVTSSEVVSTLSFASRKKLRTASLTYSEIYGSVTMSNILSLAVFLGLVYFRQLTWNFSAEVLVILVVCIVTGLIASFRTTFPLWHCLVAFALYPFSLLLVYILDYVFGWS